jgi:hypothetical protein
VIKLAKETRRRVSRGRDTDGEIGDGETEERGCEETFLYYKPNLINMKVHSATCSCSVELYKHQFTLADFLADFLPNWDISRGFLSV